MIKLRDKKNRWKYDMVQSRWNRSQSPLYYVIKLVGFRSHTFNSFSGKEIQSVSSSLLKYSYFVSLVIYDNKNYVQFLTINVYLLHIKIMSGSIRTTWTKFNWRIKIKLFITHISKGFRDARIQHTPAPACISYN